MERRNDDVCINGVVDVVAVVVVVGVVAGVVAAVVVEPLKVRKG